MTTSQPSDAPSKALSSFKQVCEDSLTQLPSALKMHEAPFGVNYCSNLDGSILVFLCPGDGYTQEIASRDLALVGWWNPNANVIPYWPRNKQDLVDELKRFIEQSSRAGESWRWRAVTPGGLKLMLKRTTAQAFVRQRCCTVAMARTFKR